MMEGERIDFGFTPSAYQERIFDFIRHGNGNAVISAKAGSGKTSTCVAAIKLIRPRDKVLFLAFNKSVAEELAGKLGGHGNVQVRTSHSLGYAMIRDNAGNDVEVDEYKYTAYIKSHVNEIIGAGNAGLATSKVHGYIESVTALVDLARLNLAQTPREVRSLAEKYDVPVRLNECEAVVKILEWGKSSLGKIDYTDMVWLPVELSMGAGRFKKDFIFIDECQDQSIASIQLFLKCFRRGTRFVAVGDYFQSVNTFCGASEEAFRLMQEYPNTTTFELPICYRCPKSIVRLARRIVPDIMYRDDAVEGDILDDCHTGCLESGDMVLSRSRAPLVRVYAKLLGRGVQCYIKGRDVGINLASMLDNLEVEELNQRLDADGVFVRLYDKLFEMRNRLMETRGMDYADATLSSYVTERHDMINALAILASQCHTRHELIERVKDVFSDDRKGVMLSTIHKAKGLEADNVYILCHSSMPSRLARKEWEKRTELNLMYVAYTRARRKLGFISEREIRPFGISQGANNVLGELGVIENIVCGVLGKTPVERKENVEVARFNLGQGLTDIMNEHEDDNFKVIGTITGDDNDNDGLLSELDRLLS